MASSSSNTVCPSPRCHCGATMVLKISRTELNPNRHFWRCVNTKDGTPCKGFVWVDEAMANARPIDPASSSSTHPRNKVMGNACFEDHQLLTRIAEKLEKLDKLDKLDNLDKLDKLDMLPSCCSIL